MNLPKRGEVGILDVDRTLKGMILRAEKGIGKCSVENCDNPTIATLAIGSMPPLGLCKRHASDAYHGREFTTEVEK